MTSSPFKRFNPESLQRPIEGSYAITDLVRRAARACCGYSSDISNRAIFNVIRHVEQFDAPAEPRQITPRDFSPAHPENLDEKGVICVQYEAARALLLIDEALGIELVTSKISHVTDRLLLAAAWISNAQDMQRDLEAGAQSIQRDADILEAGAMFVRQQAEDSRDSGKNNQKCREQQFLKNYAVALYDAGQRWKVWPSTALAAKDITPQVQELARRQSLYRFANKNALRTIYYHLLEHARNQQQRKSEAEAFRNAYGHLLSRPESKENN